MSSYSDRPNKYPLPPIFTLGALAGGIVLHRFVPIGWKSEEISWWLTGSGMVLAAGAILLIASALMTFRSHKANFHPNRAATHLLTSGPFSISRNPIYLGDVLLVAGIGLWAGSRWILLAAVVLFFLLNELVIKREEKHLEAKFPDKWGQYRQRVRRWI